MWSCVYWCQVTKKLLFFRLLHFLNIIYHMTFPLGEHLEPKHFMVPWFIRVYDFRVGATVGNRDHSPWLETVFSPRWAPRDVCVCTYIYICVLVQNETKPQSLVAPSQTLSCGCGLITLANGYVLKGTFKKMASVIFHGFLKHRSLELICWGHLSATCLT